VIVKVCIVLCLLV